MSDYKRNNGTKKEYKMPDFQFIGNHNIISERGENGWKLELNVIKWNPSDNENKFDVRVWSPDHTKMGKGISMTKTEISTLKEILNTMDDI